MLSLAAVFLGLKASTCAPKNPSSVKLETVFMEATPVPSSYRWLFTILFQISAIVCTGLGSQSHGRDAHRPSQGSSSSPSVPGGKRDPNMPKPRLCPA